MPSLSSFAAANGPIQFAFNQTQTLANAINATSPVSSSVLFTSSDEKTLNTVIKSGVSPAPAGFPGTCSVGATTCPGIASSKVAFAHGDIDIFSCKPGAYTLAVRGGGQAPPTSAGPACVPTSRGYVAPTSLAAVVNDLMTSWLHAGDRESGGPTGQRPLGKPSVCNRCLVVALRHGCLLRAYGPKPVSAGAGSRSVQVQPRSPPTPSTRS